MARGDVTRLEPLVGQWVRFYDQGWVNAKLAEVGHKYAIVMHPEYKAVDGRLQKVYRRIRVPLANVEPAVL